MRITKEPITKIMEVGIFKKNKMLVKLEISKKEIKIIAGES
ncbi:MAG TPA: hypothetical protein VF411_00150 [Bacteroidia bacterium]